MPINQYIATQQKIDEELAEESIKKTIYGVETIQYQGKRAEILL